MDFYSQGVSIGELEEFSKSMNIQLQEYLQAKLIEIANTKKGILHDMQYDE